MQFSPPDSSNQKKISPTNNLKNMEMVRAKMWTQEVHHKIINPPKNPPDLSYLEDVKGRH